MGLDLGHTQADLIQAAMEGGEDTDKPISENQKKYNDLLPIFKKASDYQSEIGDRLSKLRSQLNMDYGCLVDIPQHQLEL
ncbi:MAG: hypothetical protein HOD92_17050 [Deltaproteobacteria bacterium]|jgi:hypothetical protein|nr:hypothetical protein [Deltaproteobacteria bacterium]